MKAQISLGANYTHFGGEKNCAGACFSPHFVTCQEAATKGFARSRLVGMSGGAQADPIAPMGAVSDGHLAF